MCNKEQFHITTLLWLAGLGVVAGLYSVYYTRTITRLENIFYNISRPFVRNAICGLSLCLLILAFPILYCEGYGVMTQILNNDFSGITAGSVMSRLDLGVWLPVASAAVILIILKRCATGS